MSANETSPHAASFSPLPAAPCLQGLRPGPKTLAPGNRACLEAENRAMSLFPNPAWKLWLSATCSSAAGGLLAWLLD